MAEPTPTNPSARKLEDIMAEKNGILSPTDSTTKAGAKMRQLHTTMLPVSEGRKLVGVIDEADPDRKAAGHGHDPNTTQIAEGMNRNAAHCFEDQDGAEALRIMDEAGVDALPVVDRELRVVGMIRREDLVENSTPTVVPTPTDPPTAD